jgi:flagellar hook-basal body complex protein FliE
MSDAIGRIAAVAAQRFQSQGIGGIGGMGTGAVGADGGIAVPFTRPEGASFGETLERAINEVSAAQDRSAALTGAFVRGEPVEMHQVMAAAEEAGLSLEMLVEVRNKFTDAYRTLINMQS